MSESTNNIFIQRPRLAIVISLAILLGGILMMLTLPLEEYPSITPPQVVVSATYAGASTDVIESTIAAPVESQLNGVDNMIYMSSSSQNGSYKLTLYFDVGTDPDMAVVNVQNQLQLVTPRLPEEVRRYGLSVKKTTGGPGLLMISVTSPNNTYNNLYIANYADVFIKDEIARIKGVGDVGVFGSSNYSMRIWLDADKMAQYKLSVSDIIKAVQEQNSQNPAGDLGVEPLKDSQMLKLTIRTKGRLKAPEEFENIIIKSIEDGENIKIKDVARVELGAENYTNFSRISGKNAAIITVSQLPEANAINLSNKIKKKLQVLSKTFPKDIVYKIQHDETEFVRESIKEVVEAVVLAVILVSAVTYLFLGSFIASLIPFFAIPVSLVGVFIFMKLFGFSVNLLILFGLVLAVGLVVDDAIVVLENTQRHIALGKNPILATEATMKEVFGAVVATSLVLMAVFVPVSFMGGITGKMFKQFALCISSSIGLSTLVALTLAPALCANLLKNETKENELKFVCVFNDFFEKIKIKYLSITKLFVDSKGLTLLLLGIVLILLLLLFFLIPQGFLPQEDRGALFTQLQLQEGSTATRTNEIAKVVENKILHMDGVKDTIALVGMGGENTAFIVADLYPWSKRKKKSESATSILRKLNIAYSNYPLATVASFSPPAISGLGMFGGFEYQLLDKGGRSAQEFFNEAQKFMNIARKKPEIAMVYSTFTANLPQIMLDVDVEKAKAQGVEISEIYSAIGAYFSKTYINDFNILGRVYRVYMQGDSEFRSNLNDLSKIYVKNKTGRMVPLKEVTTYRNIVGPYVQTRFNMYPSITINGSSGVNISSGEAIKIMEDLSYKYLPKDMGFEWSGTAYQEKLTGGQIVPILVMSFIFVFLFLVGLYESWFLPVSVLLIIPIALFGALFFQYMFGYSLDIYSQIGLVMLIGLSTKQAILIVEFAKDAHNQGLSVREAALSAADLRFRAVMMTNISFILGLVPLLLATGAGAASRHSVGMTVFGGMCAVAFIGTLFVPAFYVFVEEGKNRLSEYIRNWRNRK